MGDRVSVRFANGGRISVALFSHWRGMSFVDQANWYATELCLEIIAQGDAIEWPLVRLEPNYVMVDFIRWLRDTGQIGHRNRNDIYLGRDTYDGDDSDNGHHIIDLGWLMKSIRFGSIPVVSPEPGLLTPGLLPDEPLRSGSAPRPRRARTPAGRRSAPGSPAPTSSSDPAGASSPGPRARG